MKKTFIERALPFILIGLGLTLGISIWLTLSSSQVTFLRIAPYTHTVVLDAGHGGVDGGAKSVSGIQESGINLEIALKTDALMRFYGVPTVMVRTSDVSLHDASAQTFSEKKRSDLNNRVKLTKGIENAVLLSIHQNSFQESKYFGAQMFYGGNPASVSLALTLQELFSRLDPENTREAKKVANDVFLMNNVGCPAVLAECGFLTNPREAGNLANADYQRKIAAVLLAGYLDWETAQAVVPDTNKS